MQLSEMRTEARLIFNEPDADNSHFTNSQLNAWANECDRYALTRLQSIPIKERDYTSGATISLNARMLTIDRVYLKEQPQNKFQALIIIDLETLETVDPQWPSAEVGVPRYLVRKDTGTALMYPPPDTANTGQTVRTYGMEFPADMSADGDKPSLPINLHDIYPHYMAYRAFQGLGMTDKATVELIFVNSQLKAQLAISTRFSQQLVQWIPQQDEF